MALEDDFDEDGNQQAPRRSMRIQTNPLFFIVIGITIGFVLALLFSPGAFPAFGSINQFDGTITHIDKFVSQDLRSAKVILRINDSNIAVCSDGDNCLGYQEGDTVKVTCIGNECQAVKK